VFAVSSSGLVLVSDDMGATWATTTASPGMDPLYGVSFATTCTGYVCGANKKVYETTNGGQSWTAVPIVGGGTGESFYDVQTWGNGTHAIMVGDRGEVFEKTGTRFQVPAGLPTVYGNLRDVEVLSSGATVRIGGDNGIALFRDNGVWSQPRSQTNSPLHRMSFQSVTHGFGIGQDFVITEYTP
jgi:photosystem II stability/assembly factor-like uncharacterized protein